MKPTEQGTTIKEMMVTLGILSVLAALGGYGLARALPNYYLSSAARSILCHVLEAKSRAAHRGTIWYLDFDPDGNGSVQEGQAALWEDRNENKRRDPGEPAETRFQIRRFPHVQFRAYPSELGGPELGPNRTKIDAGGGDGVSFSQNRIKFNPTGTCSAGTIYLHNPNGRTYAVRIRYNGLPQIWHHNGYQWTR